MSYQSSEYKWGFSSDVATDSFPAGLTEETVLAISKKKNEPSWMRDFRMDAFSKWLKMKEPHWGCDYDPIDYQRISYYSAPKNTKKLQDLSEADPELVRTLNKLGIPLEEQKVLMNVAVDVVFDSVSLGTGFHKKLEDAGVIFCSISEAVERYPDLIRKYLASVVPVEDNFFAALNSAVFSDGSFVFVPRGVHCPIEVSSYFRINDKKTGQFERTLIIAEDDAYVSYLEGCTAPAYDENQLHAAVVELVAMNRAHIKYSTVQNWYAGDKNGKGGIYNFVTKRGLCSGDDSFISWTQVEAGASKTWKYPSCILQGKRSKGEFYSVAVTNGHMQADTGTRMIHIGEESRSTIISKGITADSSSQTFRSCVKVLDEAKGSRSFTQCDSLLAGDSCSSHTRPLLLSQEMTSEIEHEASSSYLNEEQVLYARSRGLSFEEAIECIVGGFCKKVLDELPLEFHKEAKYLLSLKLEGAIG